MWQHLKTLNDRQRRAVITGDKHNQLLPYPCQIQLSSWIPHVDKKPGWVQETREPCSRKLSQLEAVGLDSRANVLHRGIHHKCRRGPWAQRWAAICAWVRISYLRLWHKLQEWSGTFKSYQSFQKVTTHDICSWNPCLWNSRKAGTIV